MKFKMRLKEKYEALYRALCWSLVALPASSHAATVETVLNKAAGFLTGPVAKSVGVVVLMGSGYMCLIQQKFPKEQLAMILVGLGIIFGAAALYAALV